MENKFKAVLQHRFQNKYNSYFGKFLPILQVSIWLLCRILILGWILILLENRKFFKRFKTIFSSYFSIILVAVEFFIPLLIISIAYIRIAYHLWGNKTPGIAQDLRDQALLVNKKKVWTLDNIKIIEHFIANKWV